MKTRSKTRQEQGSALLIVLGFLSFMMISAVSFAVYMRIERQASSNYRHAVTARHLLNSALCRAIDEIDSELRVTSNNIPISVKFPDWAGHTRPSAVPNGTDNGDEARVLSVEALSYVPGILVNDVRRYAVMNKADAPNGVPAGESSYLGTKWRPLSMPVNSMAGGEESYEEAVVGRYAYLCVNVSDMLNVNESSAASRKSGQVYVGQLFDTDAARNSFDNAKTNDVHYETAQDLYDCLEARGIMALGNPYQEWVSSGNGDKTYRDQNLMAKHVLVTDGRAMAEPTNRCANTDYAPLNLYHMLPGKIDDTFIKKIDAAMPDTTLTSVDWPYVKAMLQDYIDTDSKPSRLNVPSVERVPMVTQITFVPNGKAAEIVSRLAPTVAKPERKVYSIKAEAPESYGDLIVEAIFPFENFQAKAMPPDPNSYKVQAKVYLNIAHKAADQFHMTTDFNPAMPTPDSYYYEIGSETKNLEFNVSDDATKSILYPDDRDTKINKFVTTVTLSLKDLATKQIDLVDSDGIPQPASSADASSPPFCGLNEYVSVALIVYIQITDSNGNVVDQAPKADDGLGSDVTAEFGDTPKIFFQTDRRQVTATMAGGTLNYQWTALETPDPRFNYKASNWMKWKSNAGKGEGGDSQQPFINKSTTDLLGVDGRDSDIFMAVSDGGYFLSPGELGFIVRPFSFDPAGSPRDFSIDNQTAEDAEHMFRTIRIYDHTVAHPRDNVYEYFYAANADGTLSGARVNPLSDIDKVLESAIGKTPFDFGLAGQNDTAARQETYDSSANADTRTTLSSTKWKAFVEAWSERFKIARSYPVALAGNRTIKQSWKAHLRDVYGLENTFGWYAKGDTMKIFSPPQLSLDKPLHEIDRKMLMAYSLDSFSDRQQLFLYILRAEATTPSLGGKTKSLAGGQAVALVWRDPYPEGYQIDVTVDAASGQITAKTDTYNHGTWYSNIKRLSPWYQVNKNQYNITPIKPFKTDPSISGRTDGYHKSQILFFKQLDN